jgi:hypothetical protein
MVDSGENKQDVSKDIIDIIVHLMGRGLLSSAMDFLRTNFHLDSLHRFDTVSLTLSLYLCDLSYLQALIRHLFMKLFSVISPPYSSLFTSSLVDLVLHPRSFPIPSPLPSHLSQRKEGSGESALHGRGSVCSKEIQ